MLFSLIFSLVTGNPLLVVVVVVVIGGASFVIKCRLKESFSFPPAPAFASSPLTPFYLFTCLCGNVT